MLVLSAFCSSVASLVMAKPNQRQGKSHDEVMKSKLSLDAKVAEFRARVAASDMKKSDMAMMQKHFSRTELRALWSRMATQRNKEYITIRQPWTELTSIPSEVVNQSTGSCHQVKNDGKPGYCDVWNQVDNSIAKNLDAEETIASSTW